MAQSEPDPDWERRVACAEVNRRRVNEAIEQGRRTDDPQVFMCECGRVGCNTTVTLALDDYEGVRTGFERFLVVPGHEVERVDDVVERHAAYAVVAKVGATAREVARETDERLDADEAR
jgi:predicted ThiF/HesA family dinucleotide-utilizing enzyme